MTQPSRPNILWITSDQLRASALGCYGNSAASTPRIDALAGRSHLFESVHVQHTKCTPSRCSIMSGRYPHLGGHRTIDTPLQVGEACLPQLFREAGYFSQLLGKNHVVSKEYLPECFDRHVRPSIGRREERWSEPVQRGDPLWGAFYRGRAACAPEETYDGTLATEAVDWLQERATRGEQEPFFTWLTLEAPHPPFRAPEPFFSQHERASVPLPPAADLKKKPEFLRLIREIYGLDELDEEGWREVIATYYGMVSFVDSLVGRVLGALSETGLDRSTIVVFHSDHGEFLGEHGAIEKWDTAFYDCLTHVPFMISLPDDSEAARHPQLVESTDFMPTLLELCGLEQPPGVQGRSLTGLMRSSTHEHRTSVLADGGWERELESIVVDAEGGSGDYVFKHMVRNAAPETLTKAKMVRTERHKLVFRLNGEHEFYDLKNDPDELHNLWGESTVESEARALEQLLLRRLIEADDVLPVSPNPRA